MKRTTLLLFITLLVFCWNGNWGGPVPALGQITDRLQVIVIKGQFLGPKGKTIEEYDYLEPGRKYRLLPKAEVELSTLDGKKLYVAVGPGLLFLDSPGSVLFNGKPLNFKTQQPLLKGVVASKAPTHYVGGLPIRGIQVVVRTPGGNKIPLYRNSYALVVGNGNYTKGWDPLPGAIQDVKDVAKALEKKGFEVTLKTDLTKDAFNRAFWKFSHKYGKSEDTRLLFYYAGHGYTQEMTTGEDLGYLVMVDAPVPEKDPMGFNLASVDMQTIVTQAKMIKARHALFMFDSCFSGSILNLRERVVPESISDSVRLPVRQFITAGRANEPVPDHSIFKQAFLDLLEGRDKEPIPDGYITGEELGLYLKNKVPEYNPTQHPQYGKIKDIRLDKGDFVFVLKSQRPPSASYDSLLEERERLEREKRELERLKVEIGRKRLETERRRLEAEKKKFDIVKLPPKPKQPPSVSAVPKDGELARDSRFIAYANGTVLDTKTNLMWAARDDGNGLLEHDAKDYIENHRKGGYTDWRMPTMKELEMIYDRDMKNEYGYHVTKLIGITGEWVWGSEGWGNMWVFDFSRGSPAVDDSGGDRLWSYGPHGARALPVRDGN
jgi:hypothetical protein